MKFYVSFWDPGKNNIETRIKERTIINVRNMGENACIEQTGIIERRKNTGTN